jgi:hypothetical protein
LLETQVDSRGLEGPAPVLARGAHLRLARKELQALQ